jgi:hypothetical protein
MRVTYGIRKFKIWHVLAGFVLIISRSSDPRLRRKLPLVEAKRVAGDPQSASNARFSAVDVKVVAHVHEDNPPEDGGKSLHAHLTSFMYNEYYPYMITITTVPALVKAFGGTGQLAEFLEVVPSAVSNWIKEDYVPRGYHLQIYLAAKDRGLKLDLLTLGMADRPKLRPHAGAAA